MATALANALIFCGIYLQYVGSQRFFGEQPKVARGLWIILALTLVSAWYTVVDATARA